MSITLTENPLPVWNEGDERWAILPLHVLDVETHACIHCGQRAVFETYAEYTDHFWTFEYEGDRYHAPSDEDEFDLVDSLCDATAALRWQNELAAEMRERAAIDADAENERDHVRA